MDCISRMTSMLVLESRLPVGSSARIMAGLVANARAIATPLFAADRQKDYSAYSQVSFQASVYG